MMERNTNKNKVYYEVRLTKDSLIDSHKPVHAYWIMWEKDSGGAIREELNLIEKRMVTVSR